MQRARTHGFRGVVAAVVATVGVLVALGLGAVGASGAVEHRAGVVIDTGAGVHVKVVTFTEDSISGLELLERAGANPVVVGYAGQGGAVCAMYGVGHEATTQSCLGTASDPRFWAYWHVPAGQSGFGESTFSRGGAGNVRIHDGDVDGWHYGSGSSQPPAWVAVDLSPPAPPATVAPTAPPATAPASGGGVPGTTPMGGQAEPGATTGPSTSSSTTPGTAPPGAATPDGQAAAGTKATGSKAQQREAEVAAEQASAMHDGPGGGSGGSLLGIGAFLLVMLLLVGGFFVARRARAGHDTPDS